MRQAGVAFFIVRPVGADAFPKGAERVVVGHVAVRAAELVKGTRGHVGGGGVLAAGGGRGEVCGGLEAGCKFEVADEGVDALVELGGRVKGGEVVEGVAVGACEGFGEVGKDGLVDCGRR